MHWCTPDSERGHFFWARFARLSKLVVLVAKTVAQVRGTEKGKRERALFQGSLWLPLKSGGFGCKKSGTGWGLVKVW